jgi:hypothetical protein
MVKRHQRKPKRRQQREQSFGDKAKKFFSDLWEDVEDGAEWIWNLGKNAVSTVHDDVTKLFSEGRDLINNTIGAAKDVVIHTEDTAAQVVTHVSDDATKIADSLSLPLIIGGVAVGAFLLFGPK